jgi:hypothetical protein
MELAMSVKANAADAAQAWVNGMAGATPKYTAGVQAVKTAPGQLASAAAQRWAQNVAAATQKFAANSAKVTLASWQASAVNKGAPRLASGAAAAQPKFQSFMTSFIPQLSNIVAGLPAGGTFEQNMARSMAYAQQLHATAGSY